MSAGFSSEVWVASALHDLAVRIRTAARDALLDALANGTLETLNRPHAIGAGDVTYGIDVPTERVLDEWLDEVAAQQSISLLTEDAGWRHRGPGRTERVVELDGFDHGGARIVVDPIDGTRNLMNDLRSAWTVTALCAPGASEPRMSDVVGAVLSEIPDSRGAEARVLQAVKDGRVLLTRERLADGATIARSLWHVDADDRADHGYFPFFRYLADLRPEIARIEADFFARLAQREHADVRNCYDDQYISNGGQLALLTQGTYRMIADLRAFLAARRGAPTLTSKPYDIAGAVCVARAAGCVVTAVGGAPLDFPLDVKTPVSFVGWVNEATRRRLEPHLHAVLGL